MSENAPQESIFTNIINGDIPSEFLYEDEHCIVINDINPQAPVHALVIPRKPIRMLVDAQEADQELLGHLMLVARKVARDLGVGDGFRVVVNNGESVGMTIYHLHLHILGGRTFAEQNMA
jgi:histidine triad (HIT) family protein